MVIKFSELPESIREVCDEKSISRIIRWNSTYGYTYMVANRWLFYRVWIAKSGVPTVWVRHPAADFYA